MAIDGTDTDPHPSTPVGRRNSHLEVEPETNSRTTIYEREYSGHAIDRMQKRGIIPSVVENAIQTGIAKPGTSGTIRYYDPVNKITVALDTSTGRVVTVW